MATRFTRSGEISLGELVEAMAVLRPGPEAAEWLANSLGFGWRNVQAEPAAEAAAPPKPPEVTAPTNATTDAGTVRRAPIELEPVRQASLSFELAPTASSTPASGPLAPADPATASVRPPYQPLFRDLWWRALAHAMLATPTTINDIDLRIVAKHLATGRPIDRLPWRLKATLRRGVVLILDHSESMQPFWRDQRELVERCARVTGGAGVRAYWVETDPWSEAEPGLRWLQPAPESFAARTPVVIVSDFELGREMTPRWPLIAPWRSLIDKVRSSGAPLFALVPIARSLWPATLSEELPGSIVWDHDTTIGAIRRVRSRDGW